MAAVDEDDGAGTRAELEQSLARFRILAETSQQFAAITSVPELLAAITRRLSEVLGEGCGIWLVRRCEGKVDVSVATIHHPDPAVMEAMRAFDTTDPVRVGEGVTGKVIESGQPILVPRVEPASIVERIPPRFHPMVDRLAVASLLSVPLRSHGTVLGAITMGRSARRAPYSRADQELAQDLADRAALAVENALLVAELERRTSELSRANGALRQSERRFQRLSEAGIIGITVSDLRGHILEANDAFLAMLGYTREEFVAGDVTGATIVPAHDEASALLHRAQLRKDGVAPPSRRILLRKDGSVLVTLLGAARLDDASEEVIAFSLDLSAQLRAEAELRTITAQKTAVMDAALDGIILMDHHGRVLEMNAAAERLFGYTRADVVGRLFGDLMIPENMRGAHAAGLARYVATGEAHVLGRRVEVTALRRDGTTFDAEVAIVRIAADGPPVFTGYIRDITERRRAAEAELLRREKDAAEAANRELESFSYSVAHDLRSPLRGINGFSSALLEDYGHLLDDPGRSLIHRVTSSTRRMGELIDALLSLARLSRVDVEWQPVDLAPIARAVVEGLQAIDPQRAFELVVPDTLPAAGDPRLLRAVLENLLGNAWKFTRDRALTRIEVGVTELERARRYFVRDNGVGFDMTYASTLFAPFQRLHTSAEFEGSGVGLATVQRIVHRHGGDVSAESVVDAGTTISFTLPIRPRPNGTTR